MSYRPLPNSLTIAKSPIDKLGLFATKFIPTGTDLGVSHYDVFGAGLLRTPLGGFINHSKDPNCIRVEGTNMGFGYSKLLTIRDIHAKEELTIEYKLYSVQE